MKKNNFSYFTIIAFSIIVVSCQIHPKSSPFALPNERPIYTITVADATEVDILKQETGIELVKVELPLVYFYGDKAVVMDALKAAGYESPQKQDLLQVYSSYGKIIGKVNEDKLKEYNLQILNREKDHIVVWGNLSVLQRANKNGLTISTLDYEPRPREVVIVVKSLVEVQKIADLQVDIFSSHADEKRSVVIVEGAAFDYQIDKLKSLGYQVTLK